MGGDCCASNIPATPADVLAPTSDPANGTAAAPAVAPDFQEDFSAAEFKDYCKKRVDLFMQYKLRQDEKVNIRVPVHQELHGMLFSRTRTLSRMHNFRSKEQARCSRLTTRKAFSQGTLAALYIDWLAWLVAVHSSAHFLLTFIFETVAKARGVSESKTHWRCTQVEKAKQDGVPIKVTVVNDGSVREGVQDVTSSMDIAKQLDKKILKAALSAEVDGEIWDLTRPLERDCTLRILSWGDEKGKDVSSPWP